MEVQLKLNGSIDDFRRLWRLMKDYGGQRKIYPWFEITVLRVSDNKGNNAMLLSRKIVGGGIILFN